MVPKKKINEFIRNLFTSKGKMYLNFFLSQKLIEVLKTQ